MKRSTILALGLLGAACAQTGRATARQEPDRAPIAAVRFDEAVHFAAAGGAMTKVPAGSYRVEAAGDALRLTALETRGRFTLANTTRLRTPVPRGCAVLVGDEDVRQLAFARPDGITLLAAGTLSGARLRGAERQDYYDPQDTSTWNVNLSRIVLGPADFTGQDISSAAEGVACAATWERSAIAPVHLPPGAWVAGLRFSWVRDWGEATYAWEMREAGQEAPYWQPMLCILRSRDFAQREEYTVGFVDTLAACDHDDTSNPRQLAAPETGHPLETGTVLVRDAEREETLVIGHSGTKLKSKVRPGEALWVELRLPPGPRRVLAVAVEYYLPE